MKVFVYDIDWDIDEWDREVVPSELMLETDKELHGDELVEWISEEITNETGFCHRNFQYENGEII